MENMTEKREEVLHHIMCISGGFMGGYALFSRAGNFGSAQTGNLIEIILNIFGRDYKEVSLRLIALMLFILGNISGAVIKHRLGVIVLKYYTFLILILGFIMLAFIPKEVYIVIALWPIFFVSSVQWFTFAGTKKYNCSTIFSTNNLKQMVLGYIYYYLTKKEEEREKGRFYLVSLIFFHIGVAISIVLCTEFGIKASLFGVIIIVVAWLISINRKVKQSIL